MATATASASTPREDTACGSKPMTRTRFEAINPSIIPALVSSHGIVQFAGWLTSLRSRIRGAIRGWRLDGLELLSHSHGADHCRRLLTAGGNPLALSSADRRLGNDLRHDDRPAGAGMGASDRAFHDGWRASRYVHAHGRTGARR